MKRHFNTCTTPDPNPLINLPNIDNVIPIEELRTSALRRPPASCIAIPTINGFRRPQ